MIESYLMCIETAIRKINEANQIQAKEALHNLFQNKLEKDHKTTDFQKPLHLLKEAQKQLGEKFSTYFQEYYLAYLENLLTQIIHRIKTNP